MEGVCASGGSACTSGSKEPSHVLIAIGLKEEEALSSIRFSLGYFNTEDEIDRLIKIVKNIVYSIRGYEKI